MRWGIVTENGGALIGGLLLTLELSVAAWIIAMVLGTLVAIARVVPIRPLRVLGTGYVEFIRNVPLLVQIFFFYFALPSIGLRLSGFMSAMLGLGIYTAAFIAEVIRSGITGIARGQTEAAQACGLTYAQTMRLVVLPQAFRITIPPLGNQTLNLLKNSSLASTVSVFEILGTAQQIGARTFAYTEMLVAAGILYLVLTLPTALGINVLERRLRGSR